MYLVKEHLVKLGQTNPKLKKHVRPILNTLRGTRLKSAYYLPTGKAIVLTDTDLQSAPEGWRGYEYAITYEKPVEGEESLRGYMVPPTQTLTLEEAVQDFQSYMGSHSEYSPERDAQFSWVQSTINIQGQVLRVGFHVKRLDGQPITQDEKIYIEVQTKVTFKGAIHTDLKYLYQQVREERLHKAELDIQSFMKNEILRVLSCYNVTLLSSKAILGQGPRHSLEIQVESSLFKSKSGVDNFFMNTFGVHIVKASKLAAHNQWQVYIEF